MILLMILNILYASMFIISKYALLTAQPVFMTGTRMMLGGIISLIIYSYRGWSWDILFKISSCDWGLICLISLTNIYFCNAFEFWGLQYLSAGKTAFIYNLGPFFAALLAYFLFKEKMNFYKWIGLILGFAGFLPIFLEPAQNFDTTTVFGPLSLAEIAVLISSCATVIGWTTMRFVMKKTELSLFFLNGLSMILGGFLCFLHAAFFESTPYIVPGNTALFFKYVCLIAISQNIIAYNLHAFLLQKYTTTFITFSCFISSVFAALLGVFFLGETISVYFFISIIIVFIGLIIFYQQELKQGYIKK